MFMLLPLMVMMMMMISISITLKSNTHMGVRRGSKGIFGPWIRGNLMPRIWSIAVGQNYDDHDNSGV